MTEDSTFFWTRETPTDWVEALRRLSPPSRRSSYLELVWESGTPEAPTQRWVLYEACPVAFVPAWKLDAFLADPPCRCLTQWSGLERCSQCGGLNSPGRHRIKDYLHKHEALALPWWVIQGHEGGHKHRYSQIEQQWMRLTRRPDTPPDPGALCYAPFDQRVIRKVRAHDRVLRAWGNLGTAYAEEQKMAKRAFHEALADYTDTSVEMAFDRVPLRTRGQLVDELPQDHTQDRRVIDLEAERERFITQE